MYRTVVTLCTAQWSLYVPHSGHYLYHTVVTICTAQWSIFVPHSDHYMYPTVVTICTAQWSIFCTVQWSLFVLHSGHYMYRKVVTIRTAQWSLYVPPGPTQCIYVFCVDLRTNSDYFPIQHLLTGLYNRDGVCLLRGTDWVFIYNSRYSWLLNAAQRLRRLVADLSSRNPGFDGGEFQVRFVVE